jgi:AcrR family transcriptional regulator
MQPAPRRGRPPEVERDQVILVALRLFEKKGFDAVSMDEIAEAAGISRRTLFRLFPSKGDLVWDGAQEVLSVVGRFAKDIPRRSPLNAVVKLFFGDALAMLDDAELAKVARRKLKLIASSPALLTHGTVRELQGVIETVLEEAQVKTSAPRGLVAHSLFAVGFTTLVWWAQSGSTESPRELLAQALTSLAEARPKR